MHETSHGRSVSWSSVGVGTGCLRPEMKRRFPGNLKLHYSEMVGVAEKLSKRLFSRSQRTYHVHKEHKSIGRANKPSDSWVTVHNLRQLDGGILDPDDRLHDVADDREQIIAIYDEATKPQQGDGTSASDESENHSPNIFKNVDHKFEPFSRNGIEITGEELHGTPPPLHVRRGSEPALNRLSPIPPYASIPLDPSKRWSAAPAIEDQAPPSSTPLKDQLDHSSPYEETPFEEYPGERGEGSGEEKLPSSSSVSSSASSHHSATTTTLSRFTRDGNRCSVQILSDNPNMGRWAEAADRVIEAGGFFGKSEGMRREPLGGASTPRHSREHSLEDTSRPSTMLVSLNNDGSPLGIHVIPSTDKSGLDQGLLVEGIEPDGRVARDGTIRVHDVIVEINDKPLKNVTFHQAQEIFKDAMKDPELRLLIVRKDTKNSNKLIQVQERLVSGSSKMANVAQTRKTPSITLSSRTQAVMLHSNTRRIGKRLTVNLVKGSHGLGFSITTRDNPAGGEAPIYIKNILPKGAAIEEGTLRIGDRLLEVNGVPVTGYSQSEVAGLLRQIPVGGVASLIVSRQEKVTENFPGTGVEAGENYGASNQPPSPKLPRQLPSERVSEDSLMFPWKQREILTFEIPVHDSERAGLGVSVKGKTSSGPNGSVDLGIFVKNVIHGGAASRDGRLRQNDQLVNINGLSLLGKSNSEAMKTLRTAMHQEYRLRLLSQQSTSHQFGIQGNHGDLKQDQNNLQNTTPHPNYNQVQQFVGPTPGKITLTVARRVDGSQRDAKWFGCVPTHLDHSGTSEASDNTVIFNVKKEHDFDRSIDGCLDFAGPDFQMNNPVIQRLTGNANMALRNESYYKATHDTWNASQSHQMTPGVNEKERLTSGPPFDKFSSPTVNLPSRDTVLIHDEYEAGAGGRRPSGQSVVPVSSSGGVYSEQQSQSSDAYVSQTSLEESGVGFSRDQFGRQSMSEKRHATLDAKNTDTYQRNKKAREEREKYRQEMYAEMELDALRNRELLRQNPTGKTRLHRAISDESLTPSSGHRRRETPQHESVPWGISRGMSRANKDVGPGLGMRKSSSLESLQTMVQEMALEDEGQRAGSGRVPRGRGCNESFRAAVDRSYDAPLTGPNNQMETLAEEESESSGSGFGRGNSRQSSLSSSAEDKHKKANKKRQGIFKGLGSMFRFGKHRKSLDNPVPNLTEEDRMDIDKADPRRPFPEGNEKAQEQYRKLVESTEQSLCNMSGVTLPDDEGQSRSERMHQLRAEHQRRHAQRNGTYPTDDLEERYDHVIKQRMDSMPPEPKVEIQHLRSRSYDFYGDNKGGRRPGAFPDPNKFSHYVNYEQIQMHLRKNKEQERLAKLASQQYQDFRDKQTRRGLQGDDYDKEINLVNKLEQTFIHESILASREQREYQSQRCAREASYQQRPVSNYFEYESVQAVMNHAQGSQHASTSSLPRRPQQPLPHHQMRGNQQQQQSKAQLEHPQAPSPSIVNPQANVPSGPSKNSNNSQPKNHSQGRLIHPQPLFTHSRGQPPPPTQIAREGVYAASGFRPASQYNTMNQYHKSLNHSNHTSLTVPGSKV